MLERSGFFCTSLFGIENNWRVLYKQLSFICILTFGTELDNKDNKEELRFFSMDQKDSTQIVPVAVSTVQTEDEFKFDKFKTEVKDRQFYLGEYDETDDNILSDKILSSVSSYSPK